MGLHTPANHIFLLFGTGDPHLESLTSLLSLDDVLHSGLYSLKRLRFRNTTTAFYIYIITIDHLSYTITSILHY
jgi:hypothetical protein